jgi:hypothetical protein
MSEPLMRAESAPRPIDLAALPRPSRSLLKRLTSYPSWLAEGWANPSDEHLRAAAEYRDKRPIQRARRELVTRGLVEHREVRRGELLPNGERARFRHWIYVAGPGLRPPPSGGGEPLPEDRCEKGTDAVPERPPIGAFLAPRSVDLERSETVRSSAPPEAPTPPAPDADAEESTSLRSVGSTGESTRPEPPSPVRAPEVATTVLASEVARYFVAATGLGWKTIRSDVIEYLTPFLDGMNGDPGSKVARACRVIDVAVIESSSRKPTLRYVFHREMFWKRLASLGNPHAKPLARAARRPVQAPAPAKAPEAAPTAPRPPMPKSDPLADSETTRRALAAILALAGGEPSPERDRVAGEPSPFAREELAELAELYRVDNEARARRGLPPRYPPSQRAA